MAQAVTEPPPRHRREVPGGAPDPAVSTGPIGPTVDEPTAAVSPVAATTEPAPAAATPAAPATPAAAGGNSTAAGRAGPEPHKWWTLVTVCLGTFMLLLDVTIVNVALPDIQTALSTSFSGLQWVVDAYALTLAALLLTAGSLADQFGRRKLYIVGLIVFTLSSVLCGAAQDTLVLQLSRGLQGVGGAIMFAVSLALLADAFRGKDRGVAFGVWGGVTGIAVAVGPLLGGVLTTELSWRWIFLVNVPIGVVAVVLAVTRVAESRSPRARHPDWAGFALFTVGLSALVYGLIESNQRSFRSGVVIACLVGAVVLLAVFVAVELRGREPMFDLSLFRLPTFTAGSIAAFGISASIFSLLLYLVLYFQDILRFDALGTGLRLLLISAGIVATSAVSGRLSSRVPVRLLIGPGLLIVGVGLLLMRGLDVHSTWTHLIPGMLVAGVGVGLVNPPLASTAVGVVAPQRAGMASGISSTFRQVGIATGIALLGSLFSNKVSSEVLARVAAVPSLSGQGPRIATAVQSGGIGDLLAGLPASSRRTVSTLTVEAFTSGLNRILLVGAVVALVSGVIALVFIRTRDFVVHTPAGGAGGPGGAGGGGGSPTTAGTTGTPVSGRHVGSLEGAGAG